MKRKLTTEEIIKYFSSEKGFVWGMDTAIKSLSLSPNVSYDLDCTAGVYTLLRWESPLPKPTSEEIKIEYERQKTISECLEIFKNKDGKK